MGKKVITDDSEVSFRVYSVKKSDEYISFMGLGGCIFIEGKIIMKLIFFQAYKSLFIAAT